MSTQFDLEIDRRKSNSIKWAAPLRHLSPEEAAADPLPMWVADMDFRSPPAIIGALEKAVRNGIFGYSFRTESYDEAVCGWQERRFGWQARPDRHGQHLQGRGVEGGGGGGAVRVEQVVEH